MINSGTESSHLLQREAPLIRPKPFSSFNPAQQGWGLRSPGAKMGTGPGCPRSWRGPAGAMASPSPGSLSPFHPCCEHSCLLHSRVPKSPGTSSRDGPFLPALGSRQLDQTKHRGHRMLQLPQCRISMTSPPRSHLCAAQSYIHHNSALSAAFVGKGG